MKVRAVRVWAALGVLGFAVVGCASPPPPEVPEANVPPPPPPSATATEEPGPGIEITETAKKPKPPATRGSGSDKEDPVMRCGPRDSYAFVAGYECPDGSVPLKGDVRAGGASRVGNVGPNSTGHIIDLYEIPCASGAVKVYVDMYGCEEYEERLKSY